MLPFSSPPLSASGYNSGAKQIFLVITVPMDYIPREDLSLLVGIFPVDQAANFAVKVFDSPDLLSPQALQTSLSNQLNKFKPIHETLCLETFTLAV
ncbi:hypothetical protein NC652_041296 [Populus alba x Populus x berolinensis]|nr:hypothetical protein NC652_041296 [Populus alba x Populus x berolinensis]